MPNHYTTYSKRAIYCHTEKRVLSASEVIERLDQLQAEVTRLSGKTCPVCERYLPRTDYYQRPDGSYQRYCKRCHNKKNNEYRKKRHIEGAPSSAG